MRTPNQPKLSNFFKKRNKDQEDADILGAEPENIQKVSESDQEVSELDQELFEPIVWTPQELFWTHMYFYKFITKWIIF